MYDPRCAETPRPFPTPRSAIDEPTHDDREAPPASCGLRACLEWEQQHLDAIFHEVETLVGVAALRSARDRLEDFRDALAHHIDLEESGPMPAFECALGWPEGPTVEMHAEHRELQELARELAAELMRGDEPRASARAAELRRALDHHNAKDVVVLYRLVEKAASHGAAPSDLKRRLAALGGCHAGSIHGRVPPGRDL